MKYLTYLILSFTLFWTAGCSSTENQTIIDDIKAPAFTDYSNFILGDWECRESTPYQSYKMIVTFKEGIMTTKEYSPDAGDKRTSVYQIKDGNIIRANGFEDNLIVEKLSENTIRFRPETKKRRIDLEMIFSCSFVRVPE
jgi:hypothetical protein